jgi:hypothetical protein
MMASAAYVGDFTTDDILSRKDIDGTSVSQALDSIGYRGDKPVGFQKLGCFVDAHRAGSDPRRRAPYGRHRPRRARHALV